MRLCTFQVASRFGLMERLGMETPQGQILDLNLACALALAEGRQHPRPYEQANVLAPPDMLEFLAHGRSGREAGGEALAYVGRRLGGSDLAAPARRRVPP